MKELDLAKEKAGTADLEFNQARGAHLRDPKVIAAKAVYEAVLKKAEKRHAQEVTDAYARRQQAYNELRALEHRIWEEKKAKEEKIPENLRNKVKELTRRVDYVPKGLTITWYSEDGRFALVKQSGHNFFSGRGRQDYEWATEHYLIDISIPFKNAGYNSIDDLTLKHYEGKFTKQNMEECQEIVKQKQAEKSKGKT